MLTDIGAKIRAERRRHQLTQEQLAELSGTSTRTVRDIEHGHGSTSIGTVAAVASALGLALTVTP
ncbi:helix-turn-helix domain-containing protein [Nocardia sp. NPDC058480]|uniref:helix-turn-helix domain-containing protein n=1 Tax=unclassified Nocardia TaxID=2637762 RepID=UPI00364668C5